MAITASDVAILRKYAEGVMGRADHHAGQVKGVALTLLGGLIWRAEADSIRIREFAGNTTNMLWATVGNKLYVFKYNHETGKIEIRDRTQNGTLVHSFDDTTPVSAIETAVRAL